MCRPSSIPRPEAAAPLLAVAELGHIRGRHQVLADVNLAVHAGEVVALLGANGAGKSTLLRLCLGLERPSVGAVALGGRSLAACSRREIARLAAYVPQSHVSPFPYTVREVVSMGRYGQAGMFGRQRATDEAEVSAQLERMGIAGLAERPYTQISGGERQLALVCRALVQGARLLLLDEPASALDFGHQVRLLARLRQLAREGYAVLMSTHHPQHAQMIAHRVVLMKQGRIVGDGAPQDVLTRRAMEDLYDISERELAEFAPLRQGWLDDAH